MSNNHFAGTHGRSRFLSTVKSAALCFALGLSLCSSALAEGPEEDYFKIYDAIQQADTLNPQTQTATALAQYRAAQLALQKFRNTFPDWNPKVVAYRWAYLTDKIAALSAGGDTNSSSASSATARSGGGGDTKIKLLEPGAEPRTALRLHPKAGDKQNLTMALKMGMDMKMGENDLPKTKLPTMTLIFDLTIKSVSPQGDITSEMVLSDASVSEEPGVLPQVAEAMKAQLGGTKGMSGTVTMTSRGISRNVDMKGGNAADPQMKQIMDQMKDTFGKMSTPLPEEPVGAGAKWEVKMPIKSQGMTLDQTSTYQLASLEGDTANVKSSITQHAANQKISNPAMPNVKVDLTKMNSTGSGDLTWDLGKAVPVVGELNIQTEMEMGMGNGAQKQAMVMKLDVNVHMESK